MTGALDPYNPGSPPINFPSVTSSTDPQRSHPGETFLPPCGQQRKGGTGKMGQRRKIGGEQRQTAAAWIARRRQDASGRRGIRTTLQYRGPERTIRRWKTCLHMKVPRYYGRVGAADLTSDTRTCQPPSEKRSETREGA